MWSWHICLSYHHNNECNQSKTDVNSESTKIYLFIETSASLPACRELLLHTISCTHYHQLYYSWINDYAIPRCQRLNTCYAWRSTCWKWDVMDSKALQPFIAHCATRFLLQILHGKSTHRDISHTTFRTGWKNYSLLSITFEVLMIILECTASSRSLAALNYVR